MSKIICPCFFGSRLKRLESVLLSLISIVEFCEFV